MEKQVACAGKAYSRSSRAGFSMIEALISIGIIGISLGALFTLNGQQLRVVKLARDTNAATLYQQERVEQLRQLAWPDLTGANFIATTYMRNRPRSRAALDQVSEIVTISAYPKATQGSRSLRVTQAPTGETTVDSTQDGFALANERLVRVDLTLSWKAADGRQRQKTMATLISNGGITRSNLPALGSVSGGASDPFENLPTSDTTADTSTGSNGIVGSGNNGQGRGNIGGKNGQDNGK